MDKDSMLSGKEVSSWMVPLMKWNKMTKPPPRWRGWWLLGGTGTWVRKLVHYDFFMVANHSVPYLVVVT